MHNSAHNSADHSWMSVTGHTLTTPQTARECRSRGTYTQLHIQLVKCQSRDTHTTLHTTPQTARECRSRDTHTQLRRRHECRSWDTCTQLRTQLRRLLVNVGHGVVGQAEQIARSCSSGPVSPLCRLRPITSHSEGTPDHACVPLDGILSSDSHPGTIPVPILPL